MDGDWAPNPSSALLNLLLDLAPSPPPQRIKEEPQGAYVHQQQGVC